MKNTASDTFSLEMFEGPLAFLLHLIQKSEINICDVPIQEITNQYLQRIKDLMNPSVDNGAEFVGTTAFLLWMKSKRLLPKHEQPIGEEENLDPSFEIIHKLLEYCQFKEAAKVLGEREQRQSVYHTRGVPDLPEAKKNLGIEHLSLEDLGDLFQQILERANNRKGQIKEEFWKISDKIQSIRQLLKETSQVGFERLFSSEHSRGELIVTFLAILELMKGGELFVGKDITTGKVMIFAGDSG
ncbi:MAG: segregation and condensation protein A [Waddliaceae bacterium]